MPATTSEICHRIVGWVTLAGSAWMKGRPTLANTQVKTASSHTVRDFFFGFSVFMHTGYVL